MRNLFFTLAFLAFTATVFSQGGSIPAAESRSFEELGLMHVTDQIGDFTITDSDGVTWNLYEQLDAGKTVFLDLFFTT